MPEVKNSADNFGKTDKRVTGKEIPISAVLGDQQAAAVGQACFEKFTEFSKDDIVCIVEESQNKFLAVGKSLVNSSELDNMDKGEVLKNLHYISDKAWEISKTL